MRNILGIRWRLVAFFLALLVGSVSAEEIPVSGRAEAGPAPLDKLMLNFIVQQKLPGAALAVTRNGRLVYARGFGYADKEAERPVEPNSLFRIASVSKPFTSAAILQLAEAGKIDLAQTHPFADLALPAVATPGKKSDPRLEKITVLELLQHRGGFDRDMSVDPMFQSVAFAKLCGSEAPAMPAEIIRVMEGRPLDFAPGERYAYSNFGYCVLGREIEHVSGENYEAYVKKHVLEPIGITDMRVGQTLKKERAENEVTYYTAKEGTGGSVFPPVGKPVPQPYGAWCIEAMDSHGAWLASAADLVKFASELDDPKTCRILKPKSIMELFARPPGRAGLVDQKEDGKPADVWYGCGWQVRTAGPGGKERNTWHTGLLAGTSTLLVRRWDGLDWAVLFNQDSNDKGETLSDLIDPLVHQAVDAVKSWPEGKGRDEKWP